MANKNTFRSASGALLPAANALNAAGAPAYALPAKHALAQYAVTGCFNSTFYASAEAQVKKVVDLAYEAPPEFVAKTAIYARERGYMKDSPALLCAVLSIAEPSLCAAIFPRVIDDVKMLRNFVQMVRSGVTGRKSLGTAPKRWIKNWLEARSEDALFRGSIGQSPSLVDVVKMVHPKPANDERRAFYGYLLNREFRAHHLPEIVKALEAFKLGSSQVVPDVPFQMLTALALSEDQWAAIAKNSSWQATRMNLNTFARHGVFKRHRMVELIAQRLRDATAVRQARAFPYQLFAAFRSCNDNVPEPVLDALQDAMEHSIHNVPTVGGKAYVLVDVSGSMQDPITGHRKGATSKISCIDGAAMVAAAILRKNPSAEVIPFAENVRKLRLNPRDSVLTNAQKLSSIGGGGTDCSAPLRLLNGRKAKGDLVVFVSDNESWVDARQGSTEVMKQWQLFKSRNPNARLACLDFVPNATTQAAEREDILNIGGFSDSVFDLLALFADGQLESEHWVGEVEKIAI
ncbi:MAG: TROVE domain-containing protein [Polyangiaceae bacterium]